MAETTTDAMGTEWVCTDCIMALVNDEWPDRATHDGPWPLCLVGNMDVTPGTECGEGDDHYSTDPDGHSEGCETRNFSTRPCFSCGEYLAGTRHAVTVWDVGRN